ncbi:hypothetical protein L6452_05349 [Arctium lappa]|uniref:Uncharacterized protein n=1 Tax=Arctium lappa TaxID=4217 RepID=A0ACB9EGG1_ARCLA|nr:hypothetical protein L6452_05349 [Arctium lappa]
MSLRDLADLAYSPWVHITKLKVRHPSALSAPVELGQSKAILLTSILVTTHKFMSRNWLTSSMNVREKGQ